MSVRSFDLSSISPDNIEPLREAVREVRTEDGNASLWINWKGEMECPLTITRQWTGDLSEPFSGCFSNRNGLFIKNYGSKQKNAYHHPGGFAGTIVHEWCHRMQWFAADNSIGNWYREVSHPEQDLLYKKWSGYLQGAYAATAPEEMAAELFRVLKGWRGKEAWEDDQELLEDWMNFFTNDPVFRHFF